MVEPEVNQVSPETFPLSSFISSDDDDDDDKATRTPGAAKVSKRKKREDLEGSKTKYLPPEDSSDSSDEAEDEPTLKSGRGSGDKGAGNYVDLDLPTGDGVVKSKQREAPVVYAEIPTVPPPPPVKVTPATGGLIVFHSNCIFLKKKHVILHSSVYSLLPPAPPSPSWSQGDDEEQAEQPAPEKDEESQKSPSPAK